MKYILLIVLSLLLISCSNDVNLESNNTGIKIINNCTTKIEYKDKVVYKDKIVNNTIYKECDCNDSVNIAMSNFYITNAKKKANTIYKKFSNKEWDECKEDSDYIIENLMIGNAFLGKIKVENYTLLIDAYDDYISAVRVLNSFCYDANNQTDIPKSKHEEYKKWYDRYKEHLEYWNLIKDEKIIGFI